jgi:hypothetical protein
VDHAMGRIHLPSFLLSLFFSFSMKDAYIKNKEGLRVHYITSRESCGFREMVCHIIC